MNQSQIIEVTKQSNRLEFIDVGRAIAAMAVIFQHAVESVNPDFNFFTQNYFSLGIFGVTLFFLISGYVIPPSLERVGVFKFWISRFFRLYPLYWLSIILVIMIGGVALDSAGIKKILINSTMFQEYFKTPHLMGVYWTLSMEMLFYFLCTFAFIVIGVRYHFELALLVVTGTIILVTANVLLMNHSLPFGRLVMILTAFCGMYIFREKNLHSIRSLLLLVLFIIALVLCGIVRFQILPSVRTEDEAVFSAFCAIVSWLSAYLVFYILYVNKNRHFPIYLTITGTWCYSLYLLHPLIVGNIHTFENPILNISWEIVLCMIASWFSWTYFEKPIINLGKKVSKSFKTNNQIIPQPTNHIP